MEAVSSISLKSVFVFLMVKVRICVQLTGPALFSETGIFRLLPEETR